MNDVILKRFESPDETRVFEKGKFGLTGKASDLKTALQEKERLFSWSTATAMLAPGPTA